MYDDHMAVLLYNTRQRVQHATPLHARFHDNDFPLRGVSYIYEILSCLYDDVFVIICATIYHNMLVVALLCRHITKYSRELFDMCHLYHLHLHSHSIEALSLLHYCHYILNNVRTTLVFVER